MNLTLISRKKHYIFVFFVFLLSLVSCEKFDNGKEPINPTTDEAKITSFILKKELNPQLKADITAEIDDKEKIITLVIDYDVTSTLFTPTITLSDETTISPDASQQIDGLKQNKYTVTRKDASKEYSVKFLINQPLSLISLNVNGAKAWYNEVDDKYYTSIHEKKWSDKAIIAPYGTGIQKVLFDGVEIDPTQPSTIIDLKKEHTLRIEKGGSYLEKTIVARGLPIFVIDANFKNINNIPEKNEARKEVEISVYDGKKDGKYTVEKLYAGIKRRGGWTSSEYNGHEKLPYSIEFWDKDTKLEKDTTLFGLRKDGDWILDACATDYIRTRNRISTDIWNDIARLPYKNAEPKARPGTRGKFVELFFNGKYHGMYCITEKVDRNQLNLDMENGYLYKAKDWDVGTRFKYYYSLPNDGDENWIMDSELGWQTKYPKPNFKWTPLVDLTKFIVDNNGDTFKNGIVSRFDIDNLVDFFLFINLIGGTDNISKNSYVGFYNLASTNNKEKLGFYTAWDLDATFGREYDHSRVNNDTNIYGLKWGKQISGEIINHLILKAVQTNAGDINSKIKSRWTELRQKEFKQENLMARFYDYQKRLENSGAYQREIDAWQGGDETRPLTPELEYINSWLTSRLSYLDNYIQNWDSHLKEF
ncbi:MAG: CotH kinase family protein [Bacteroidetes bacterium]|nr:CotH kinase family protein [Bacteroidota bacterium]